MFDNVSDNKVKYLTNRICGKGRPVPVRSGWTAPRLARRERTPLSGQPYH